MSKSCCANKTGEPSVNDRSTYQQITLIFSLSGHLWHQATAQASAPSAPRQKSSHLHQIIGKVEFGLDLASKLLRVDSNAQSKDLIELKHHWYLIFNLYQSYLPLKTHR